MARPDVLDVCLISQRYMLAAHYLCNTATAMSATRLDAASLALNTKEHFYCMAMLTAIHVDGDMHVCHSFDAHFHLRTL